MTGLGPSATDQQGSFEGTGFGRMVFFSDAVVAIAIALIVLPLVDKAGDPDTVTVLQFAQANGYALVAAATSFAAIGAFWLRHHTLFCGPVKYSPIVLKANFLWLACIVCIPVATILDVGPARTRGGTSFYLMTIAATMASSLVLKKCLALRDRRHDARRAFFADWSPVFLLVIAAVAVHFAPQIGLFGLSILLLTRPVGRIVRGRVPA